MTLNQAIRGNILALITIIIWGTTFISTKIILEDFSPIEILFCRFTLGIFVLFIIYPHKFKTKGFQEEKYIILAGLTGVLLYYLLENIALTMTTASNVAILGSISPFFTAILARLLFKTEKASLSFYIGFVMAIIGIIIVSLNGTQDIEINPFGDIIAIISAFVWALYSNITRNISTFGYNTILTTRRSFLYGLIFMVPVLFIADTSFDTVRFMNPVNWGNLLFLGVGASAICFLTWNTAIKYIGAVKTSVYIYFGPIITLITSIVILKEKITFLLIIGIIFIVFGLLISEKKLHCTSNKNGTLK